MPFTSFSAAGVALIQMGIVNTQGIPYGVTGTITPGQGVGMRVMKFSKRLGGQVPNPVRVTLTGDNNRNRHEYLFNAAQMGELAFQLDAFDMQAYAGFQGLKVVTDANSSVVLLQSNQAVNVAQACIIATVDAQDADAGAFGEKKFINEIFPLVSVAALLASFQETAKADWNYFGVPTQADKTPWGTTWTATTNGATRAGGLLMTSDYPMTLDTVVPSSTTGTYSLANTPAGTEGTNYIVAYQSGVAFTNFTVSGKVVTYTGASTSAPLIFRSESTDILANN